MPQSKLFVSYARADEPLALLLCARLACAGQDVWLDLIHLPPGADWWDEARDALDRSAGLLFLVSDQSSRSLSCSRELTYAVARGKPIVRIEAVRAARGEAICG
jgi:hypothetical protein